MKNEKLARREQRERAGERAPSEIIIEAGALDGLGAAARRNISPEARRVVVVSNRRVFDLYGGRAVAALRSADFSVASWLMGDGERHKSLRTAERALHFFSARGLERSDAVVALGGGVVGDLAGFAAAVYLRGIDFLQVPTTLLAQIDAAIGGKTAVNTASGKNLIGAFHHPRAVVIDPQTLATLPARELAAGWCEAIKHGAVGSRALFEETRRFLAAGSSGAEEMKRKEAAADKTGAASVAEELTELIAAHVAFKARVVAGDAKEAVERRDHRSRRILNFGHTVGHALERVTSYRRFRHGEAVGWGMLAAGEISVKLGLLDVSELEYLRDTIRSAGRLPRADDLEPEAIMRALATDKKVVGGGLRWVLLERIGRARIVDGREIEPRLLRSSLRASLRR